jgi:hypothetical protein
LIADAGAVDAVRDALRAAGETPRVIGEVVARDGAARVDLAGKLEFDA